MHLPSQNYTVKAIRFHVCNVYYSTHHIGYAVGNSSSHSEGQQGPSSDMNSKDVSKPFFILCIKIILLLPSSSLHVKVVYHEKILWHFLDSSSLYPSLLIAQWLIKAVSVYSSLS